MGTYYKTQILNYYHVAISKEKNKNYLNRVMRNTCVQQLRMVQKVFQLVDVFNGVF
jgi:DNA-directed RNA polymerase specialized sigma24 family protein